MCAYDIEPIANFHCACGENPYWEVAWQRLLWADIPTGRLFRYDLRSGTSEQFHEGPRVGGFTLQADDTLLLFRENEFSRLHADGRTELLKDGIDAELSRFNDVIADPEGRVFAGTIGKSQSSGGLYRVEVDGTVTRLFQGTGCSNGMDWSPDLRHFYWTDSTHRVIYRFDYRRETGELANRREFVSVPEGEGVPDGMTVDSEGCLWSARWDGHALFRYSPEGELLETIRFPVAKVSSAIFGGPDLRDLYVTTAGGSADATTEDGTLYRVRGIAQGREEFRSRILLHGSLKNSLKTSSHEPTTVREGSSRPSAG